jgi:hypothetical protein
METSGEGKYQVGNTGPMQGPSIGDYNTVTQSFYVSGSAQAPLSTLAHIWTVPYLRNPFFTGREDVLMKLHSGFTSKTAPIHIQAICGLGGIGKTQLALEYAYHYYDTYQYIFWINAASMNILTSEFVKLVDILNLPEKNNPNTSFVIQAVKLWFTNHPDWLLIFDNVDDPAVASTFFPSGNNGHILFTTRLHTTRAIATAINLVTMNNQEAILFLLRRSGLLGTDADLSEAADAHIQEAEALVEEVDAFPLALEQAGAYIEETGCSLSEYLTLYRTREHRSDLLKYQSTSSTRYSKSIATTWSLSFENIRRNNPAATDILQACAFLHPDAIPEELIIESQPPFSFALGRIVSDPFKVDMAFKELLRYSLISRNSTTKTLTIHRLVQVVLQENMSNQVQRRWSEKIIQAIYLALCIKIRERDAHGYNISSDRVLRYLFHAFLCSELIERWNIATIEAEEMLMQLAKWMSFIFDDKEQEIIRLCQQIATIQLQLFGANHHKLVKTLTILGDFYIRQDQLSQVDQIILQLEANYEKILIKENPDVLNNLISIANCYMERKLYKKAEQFLIHLMNVLEEIEGYPESMVLVLLAQCCIYQDKYKEAEQFLTYLMTTIGDKVGYSKDTLISLLVQCYIGQNKYDEAEQLLIHKLEIWDQQKASDRYILSLNNIYIWLVELYLAISNHELAQFYYEQIIELWEHAIMQISLSEHDSAQKEQILNLVLNNLPSIIKEYSSFFPEIKKEHEAVKLEVYINELMSKYAHVDMHSFHTIAVKPSPFIERNEVIALGDKDGERKVHLYFFNIPSP